MAKRWCGEESSTGWHVYPTDDAISHDIDTDECICGVRTEAVQRADGSVGWLLVHHSLDGREHKETPAHTNS